MEQTGEGMRIQISETSKQLLDKVGGFRCDPKGSIECGVSRVQHYFCIKKIALKSRMMNTYWLIGPNTTGSGDFDFYENHDMNLVD